MLLEVSDVAKVTFQRGKNPGLQVIQAAKMGNPATNVS